MGPEQLHHYREQVAYIKDIKELIISDGRAYFSTLGAVSHKSTLDVITSCNGGWQATLIMYHDLSMDSRWQTMAEGPRCRDLCTAVKLLWDWVQTELGYMKALQAMHSSPVSTMGSHFHPQMRHDTPAKSQPSETPVPFIKALASEEEEKFLVEERGAR